LGYLKCEKCGGYYELQEGESPEDFDVCECGGELKHVKTIAGIDTNLKETSIDTICPVCGTKNTGISQFCASCGNNLSEENEKSILRDEKVSNLQKKYKKPEKPKIQQKKWYKKKFTIAVLILLLLMILTVSYAINLSTNVSPTTIDTLQNAQSSKSSNSETPTSTSTQTQSSGDDYDRGYDEGYFSGVNEAYSDWPYADEVSKSLKVSETWRQGYKEGYKQGYNDIKNGNSLKKPRIQGTAILDPRTGEKIYG